MPLLKLPLVPLCPTAEHTLLYLSIEGIMAVRSLNNEEKYAYLKMK